MKCAFCQKIGSYLSLSLERDEIVPKEIDNFETVLISKYKFQQVNFPVTYIRCPVCHTYFRKTRTIDNEIMHGSDDVEFQEMTEERINELIKYQENEMKSFSEDIDSRLGCKLADLTPTEKAIINIFKNELKDEITIYDIADKFEKNFQTAIDTLIEKNILKKYSIRNIEHYRIC